MKSRAFVTVTRRTVQGISRRASLLTLGGAALAATVAKPDVSEAKKKKGKDCKKKDNQRCSNDTAACKATIQTVCNPDMPAACLRTQACCEDCSADGILTCLLAANASMAAKLE